MTVLAFLLALGVLVTVHEWGHYRMAIACGVKVQTFSIGFGRPLLRWKSRTSPQGQDTEFSIGWIPLGGFVKMLDEREGEVRAQDLPMAFNRQPLRSRAAIVLAGPLANLLMAVCLFAVVFWAGQYQTQAMLAAPVSGSAAELAGLRSGDAVLRAGNDAQNMQDVVSLEALRWWVIQQDTAALWLEVRPLGQQTSHLLQLPALLPTDKSHASDSWALRGLTTAWSRAVLREIKPDSAAQRAGLQPGDEVLSVNGQLVSDGATLRALIRQSGVSQEPVPQTWTIARAGLNLSVVVTPERVIDAEGYIGRLGAQVGDAFEKTWVQYSFFEGLWQALIQTVSVAGMTIDMLGRLVIGQASFDHLSGPLGMADHAGRSASLGFVAYVSYLALLSVSLGVFNLLPLPVLDGGHLLYYLYEGCMGRPLPAEWLDVMQRAGLVALAALMIFSLAIDVVRLGWMP